MMISSRVVIVLPFLAAISHALGARTELDLSLQENSTGSCDKEWCKANRETICNYFLDDDSFMLSHDAKNRCGGCGNFLKPLCRKKCDWDWCVANRMDICDYSNGMLGISDVGEHSWLIYNKPNKLRCGGCLSSVCSFGCEEEWCYTNKKKICWPAEVHDFGTVKSSLAFQKEPKLKCGGCGSVLTPFCDLAVRGTGEGALLQQGQQQATIDDHLAGIRSSTKEMKDRLAQANKHILALKEMNQQDAKLYQQLVDSTSHPELKAGCKEAGHRCKEMSDCCKDHWCELEADMYELTVKGKCRSF